MLSIVRGLCLRTNVREKSFNGVVEQDKQGNPVIQRKCSAVDYDSQSNNLVKFSFPPHLESQLIDSFQKQVNLILESFTYDRITYYKLVAIVDDKKCEFLNEFV